MSPPWLPDFIARWYDDFRLGFPFDELDDWEACSNKALNYYRQRLCQDPNTAALELDNFIQTGNYQTLEERRFRALRLASDVFHEMGFRNRRIAGGEGWAFLRTHWLRNGNLLRDGDGLLLPREHYPYDWSWNIDPSAHTPEGCFDGFARWSPHDNPNLKLRSSVLTFTSVPGIDKTLRIAVVPLIDSMTDLQFIPDDSNPNSPKFRVTPLPTVEASALLALERSADAECDIVLFPELCLTPAAQGAIGKQLLRQARTRPWLVVAGSAATPVGGGSTGHHNRSLVFDNQGRIVLSHHKMHRFTMDVPQQDRYSICGALGGVDRIEDMQITPIEMEILDTHAGRLAVLICEDLSVPTFVEPLIAKLGLDWLLVPVLDGCQRPGRWTERYGNRYAGMGAAVVVATSLSMARQHLESQGITGNPGIGLIVVPTRNGPTANTIACVSHDQPTYFDLPVW